jgi:hypothetical protein
MEKWKVALCKRAKTGRPASDWPNHLGWWPISVETREGARPRRRWWRPDRIPTAPSDEV